EVGVLAEGVHSGHAGGIVPSSFRLARELLSRVEDERDGSIRLPELHGPGIPAGRQQEIDVVANEYGDGAAARIRAGTWEPCLEVTGAAGLPEPSAAGNVLR